MIVAALCLFAATAATAETRTMSDIRYGAEGDHRLDVYWDDARSGAPVIVMLHGGGWKRGGKEMPAVWKDKVAWWLPKGYVFVSVETRLLPQAAPDEQAQDFAKAVAFVQANATRWGGDPSRVVLMGHSAGAHVAALVASDCAPASIAG